MGSAINDASYSIQIKNNEALTMRSELSWDHAFSICFTVRTNNGGNSVTKEELVAGLEKRLEQLKSTGEEIIEACGQPIDTFSALSFVTHLDGIEDVHNENMHYFDLREVDGKILKRISKVINSAFDVIAPLEELRDTARFDHNLNIGEGYIVRSDSSGNAIDQYELAN
jgi:hypothetical protein